MGQRIDEAADGAFKLKMRGAIPKSSQLSFIPLVPCRIPRIPFKNRYPHKRR
jgi:hypothetical protein